jgi:hypothetical protein
MTAPIEPTDPSNLFTPFLPATFNIPEEEDRFRVFLNDKLSAISDVVNDKKIGMYADQTENLNGEKWFFIDPTNIRNGYQAILYISSFVTGSLTMPIPNVTPQFRVTQVMGSVSKPCSETGAGDGDYFSFMNQGDSRISFTVSDLTITITASGPMSAYSGFIIIHYLRDGF